MMAPPPMPNSPARMPVTMPPPMIATASQPSSPRGTPNINGSAWTASEWSGGTSRGGGVRQIGTQVHDQGQRVTQHFHAAAGLDALGRDVAAERARAGHRMEQTEQ